MITTSRPAGALPAVALLTGLSALFGAPAASGLEGPWQENPESRVRLVSPWEVAPATGPWQVGLEFETEPGWHVYWKNSGDAGYPPAIDFSAASGVDAVEISWPAPERYLLPGDLEALGYEGSVIYPLELAIRPDGDRVELAADLDYLVCEVDCIPYSYRLTLDQPVAAVGGRVIADATTADRLAEWQARLPRPAAELGVAAEAVIDLSDAQEPWLEVRLSGVEAAAGTRPEIFLEADETFDFGIPRRLSGSGDAVAFRVPASFWQVPERLPPTVELAWTVTGLATGDATGVAIESRQAVPLQVGGLVFPPGAAPRPSAGRLVLLLAGAFLGGVLLHLTPTMLPLTFAHGLEIAGRATTVAQARSAALTTAAGSFAGALALAAAALTTFGGGRAVTWGTQLQEPALVALLAIAATLLTLGLWGLFDWPLRRGDGDPSSQPRRQAVRGLLTGLAAAVLILPWSLPPLPESVGPALAAGPGSGLLAFAALGVGLAVPWLAIATLPQWAGRLGAAARRLTPTARRRLGEGLGFLAASSVVWLLYLLSRQLRSDGLALLELLLLCLALVAWVRASARRRAFAAALALLLAVLAVATVWVADARRLVPRVGEEPVAALAELPARPTNEKVST